MSTNSQRTKQLLDNLSSVASHIQAVKCTPDRHIRLVLVSKLKPASDILALHTSETQPSHFGENYFQELTEKAAVLPKSIRWHFIGALQSNKCKPLAEQIPNLWCVSSVDSTKKAEQLEKGRKALLEKVAAVGEDRIIESRLRVMVQVNTSGEESKSGVEPSDTLSLCRHIKELCPHLQLSGLMTIGSIAQSQSMTSEKGNEDFACLRQTRDKVASELGIGKDELELSMGMSGDFESAITEGSSEVRIGSTIFGERPPKKDA